MLRGYPGVKLPPEGITDNTAQVVSFFAVTLIIYSDI